MLIKNARSFTSVEDVVSFGDLTPLKGQSDWSAFALIRPHERVDFAGIVSKRIDFAKNQNQFTFWLKKGFLQIEADVSGRDSNLSPPLRRWSFVGVSASQTCAHLFLGIDGEVQSHRRTGLLTGELTANLPLRIGKPGPKFAGDIAFVCLYNRAIEESRMRELCSGTTDARQEQGLVFAWTATHAGDVDLVSRTRPEITGTRFSPVSPATLLADNLANDPASEGSLTTKTLVRRRTFGGAIKYAQPMSDIKFAEIANLNSLGNLADPHKLQMYPSVLGRTQLKLFREEALPADVVKEHYSQATSLPIYVYAVPNAELASGFVHIDGKVFLGGDVIPSYFASRFHEGHHTLSDVWKGCLYDQEAEVLELDTPVAVALHPNMIYGHVLLEMLPRLGLLAQLKSMGANFPLAVPTTSPPFVRKIVNQYFEDNELVFYDPRRQRVRAPCFVLPSMMHRNHYFHPAFNLIVDEFKRRVLRRGVTSSAGSKIYLSRSRFSHGWHGIENEKEVEVVVADLGFDVVHPHELELRDQIAIYAEASYIVGEYSSALHNSLFASIGTGVFSINRINWYQSQISALRGQRLAYLLPADNRFRDYRVSHHSPDSRFEVDCEQLRAGLQAFLQVA